MPRVGLIVRRGATTVCDVMPGTLFALDTPDCRENPGFHPGDVLRQHGRAPHGIRSGWPGVIEWEHERKGQEFDDANPNGADNLCKILERLPLLTPVDAPWPRDDQRRKSHEFPRPVRFP